MKDEFKRYAWVFPCIFIVGLILGYFTGLIFGYSQGVRIALWDAAHPRVEQRH